MSGSKCNIFIIAVFSVLTVLATSVLIYYFGAEYPTFDRISREEAAIPGLDDGFVPQGLAALDGGDYLVSGYMADGDKSRIYTVSADGRAKYITVSGSSDMAVIYGHFGGISTHGDLVWVASERSIMTLSLDKILRASDGADINIIAETASMTEASYCYARDGRLYVGEFYRKDSHETNPSHSIGDNNAIVEIYDITDRDSGISESPIAIMSVPDKVQGMAITDSGEIILSVSYSIVSSKIRIYTDITSTMTEDTILLGDTDYPLYMLDKGCHIRDIAAPAMSEGIDFSSGRLHILFESACKKYRAVNRTRLKNVISIEI